MSLLENKNKHNEKNLAFESYKDLLMYYNTAIRNVTLSTAVSFAALGYSRFYRGKSKLYSVGLVVVSLLLLIFSTTINYLLYNDIEKYKNLPKYKEIKNWRNLNILFLCIHSITILFALYTLFRLVTNNQFIAR